MTKYPVCYVDELAPGSSRIVEIEGKSIGVFRVGNDYYAVRNRCPHKGAPLCKGLTRGLITSTKPGEFIIDHRGRILSCPWHGWEFDLATGRSVFNPHKLRVKRYDVSIDEVYDYTGCITSLTEDPSIETFSISVEEDQTRAKIYVHV
jgi:nitrite reductase/ring-hydroxylating ferredoxin subunit